MAAGRIFLSTILICLADAFSNVTLATVTIIQTECLANYTVTPVTRTETECVLGTPVRTYPLLYSPCDLCNSSFITDVRQPITSAAVTAGATTRYVAPFWEWNFDRTKTVTVITDAVSRANTQTQTWLARKPTCSISTMTDSNVVTHYYEYEAIILYVIEEPNYVFNNPTTVTFTSTVTSVYTNTAPSEPMSSQMTVHEPPLSSPVHQAGQGSSALQGPEPGPGPMTGGDRGGTAPDSTKGLNGNSSIAAATDDTLGPLPSEISGNAPVNGFPITTFGASNITGGIDSSGATLPDSNDAVGGPQTDPNPMFSWDLLTATRNGLGNVPNNGFLSATQGPTKSIAFIGGFETGNSDVTMSESGGGTSESSRLLGPLSSPTLGPLPSTSSKPAGDSQISDTDQGSGLESRSSSDALARPTMISPGLSSSPAPETPSSLAQEEGNGIPNSDISNDLASSTGDSAIRSPMPQSSQSSPSQGTESSVSNANMITGSVPASAGIDPDTEATFAAPSASSFVNPALASGAEGLSSVPSASTIISSALARDSVLPSTSIESGADTSSSAPFASPSNETRSFQLYVKNDVEGLNTLAVGEDGYGE